jgi:predicted nucleic acid-binding protein
VLTRINLIVDDDAGMLPPPRLRTLDAIHLVAAQRAERSLRAVVTNDSCTANAAAVLGVPTVSPGMTASAHGIGAGDG